MHLPTCVIVPLATSPALVHDQPMCTLPILGLIFDTPPPSPNKLDQANPLPSGGNEVAVILATHGVELAYSVEATLKPSKTGSYSKGTHEKIWPSRIVVDVIPTNCKDLDVTNNVLDPMRRYLQ